MGAASPAHDGRRAPPIRRGGASAYTEEAMARSRVDADALKTLHLPARRVAQAVYKPNNAVSLPAARVGKDALGLVWSWGSYEVAVRLRPCSAAVLIGGCANNYGARWQRADGGPVGESFDWAMSRCRRAASDFRDEGAVHRQGRRMARFRIRPAAPSEHRRRPHGRAARHPDETHRALLRRLGTPYAATPWAWRLPRED